MKYAKWLLCLLPFVIGYLVGSFTVASWDINDWNNGGRFLIAISSLLVSVAIAIYHTPESK